MLRGEWPRGKRDNPKYQHKLETTLPPHRLHKYACSSDAGFDYRGLPFWMQGIIRTCPLYHSLKFGLFGFVFLIDRRVESAVPGHQQMP